MNVKGALRLIVLFIVFNSTYIGGKKLCVAFPLIFAAFTTSYASSNLKSFFMERISVENS